MLMTDPQTSKWSLGRALWQGVRDLFPTRKTRSAVIGLVALGVATTFMELFAAQLFSNMILSIGDQPASESTLLLVAFVVAFSAVKGIQYFQSVYRLTVFDRAFRRAPVAGSAAEAWRWPMAIDLVGVLCLLARLAVIIGTVAISQWTFGVVLFVCSALALYIVGRTGRKQYIIHHEFAEARRAGRPPTASERIGTRVRAGERAGLVASIPIIGFVAALGVGAVYGAIQPESALVLFIAGRMAANLYGGFSASTMRFIRAEVNVEAFGGRPSREKETTAAPSMLMAERRLLDRLTAEGALGEPPAQAAARLIDRGVFLGSSDAIGQAVRAAGFGLGPLPPDVRDEPSRRSASGPNEVWWVQSISIDVEEGPPAVLNVVLDAFSRAALAWSVTSVPGRDELDALVRTATAGQGVEAADVEIVAAVWLSAGGPNVFDLLRMLGALRALRWSAPEGHAVAEAQQRPRIPDHLRDAGEVGRWADEFFDWYNHRHLHAELGYLHPADVHRGLADELVRARSEALDRCDIDGVAPTFPDAWAPPESADVEIGTISTKRATSTSAVTQEDYEFEGP
jgi:putative transposase